LNIYIFTLGWTLLQLNTSSTVIINNKTTFGADRGARCENAKTMAPSLPRTPRDCHGTEQWQNQIPCTGQESAQAPLGGHSGALSPSSVSTRLAAGGMNTIYIHLFRRHEYRYYIFFSPLAEYDIIFNLGPLCEYVNTYSTRRLLLLLPPPLQLLIIILLNAHLHVELKRK